MTQQMMLQLANLDQLQFGGRAFGRYQSMIEYHGYQTIDYFGVDLQVPNGFYWWVCCNYRKYMVNTQPTGLIWLYARSMFSDNCQSRFVLDQPKHFKWAGKWRWHVDESLRKYSDVIACIGGTVDICNNTGDQCRNSLIGVDLRRYAEDDSQIEMCLNDVCW